MRLAAAVMKGFPAAFRHSLLAGILQLNCYRVPASLSAFSINERKYSVRYQAHPTSVTSSAADISRQ